MFNIVFIFLIILITSLSTFTTTSHWLHLLWMLQFLFFPKFPILIFQFLGCCGLLREQRGEFITLNSSGIVYSYDSVLIGTLVMVSIYLFFTLLFGSYCPEFFELTSTITITVLTPVSYNYMVSLASGGKKSGDVGLTCMSHELYYAWYYLPTFYIVLFFVLICLFFCYCCFIFIFLWDGSIYVMKEWITFISITLKPSFWPCYTRIALWF